MPRVIPGQKRLPEPAVPWPIHFDWAPRLDLGTKALLRVEQGGFVPREL